MVNRPHLGARLAKNGPFLRIVPSVLLLVSVLGVSCKRNTHRASELGHPEAFNPPAGRLVTEVQKLAQAGEASVPAAIVLSAISTVGWGCPCPPFALAEAEEHSLTDRDEAYITVVTTSGLPAIEAFRFRGRYRISGHYTGRKIGPDYGRKQTNGSYEFMATDWCYHPPEKYDPSECGLDGAEKPGMRWCSTPPKVLCRTLDMLDD